MPSEEQLSRLRMGVMITTPVQREASHRLTTAKTLPCKIHWLGGEHSKLVCVDVYVYLWKCI